jgi:hypothetical protein
MADEERVAQNDHGLDLPLDLIGGAPKFQPRAKAGQWVTLVDIAEQDRLRPE